MIAAKRLGAEQIILLGNNPERVALGQEFGATDVVRERGEEAVERVRELTGGLGAHSVLECVGLEQAVVTALEIARPGGAIGRVGVPEHDTTPTGIAFWKNASMAGGPAPVRAYIDELLPGRAGRPDRARPRLRPHRHARRGARRLPADERPRSPQVPDRLLRRPDDDPDSPLITLNNGVEMPALGLGVFQSPPAETIGAVEAAIASGYRLIDTAAAYGNEREVGEGIRRSGIDRAEIFVTTKLWISDYGYEQALAGSTAACAGSASTTSTSSCSTTPSRATSTRTVAAYTAAEQMLADGRARAIGVSNFSQRHLENLIGQTSVVPAVNQVELHPFFTQQRAARVPRRERHRTQAWSPLGGVNGTALPTRTQSRIRSSTRRSSSSPRSTARRRRRSCSAGTSSRRLGDPEVRQAAPHRRELRRLRLRAHADEVAAIDALDTGVRGGPDPELIDTELYPFKVEN